MKFGKLIVIVVSFLLLFLLLFLLVVIGVLFSFSSERNITKKDEKTFKYQYLLYDPSKNESYVSMSTLTKELPPDEFVSYRDGNGEYVLISKIGVNEYICSGYCFCEGEEERRFSGAVLSKPLKYLVAAVTSLVAVEIARKYFESECVKELSEHCPFQNRVKSEIEDCQPLKMAGSDLRSFDASKDHAEHEIDDDLAERIMGKSYICDGICQINKKYKPQEGDTAEAIESAKLLQQKCSHIHLMEVVFFELPKAEWDKFGTFDAIDHARFIFQNEHLRGACASGTKNGLINRCESILKEGGDEEVEKVLGMNVLEYCLSIENLSDEDLICVASNDYSKIEKINPSVQCLQGDPGSLKRENKT